MSQVNAFPAGKLTVVLDAIHTLLLDLGSPAKTSSFLRRLYKLLHLRSANLVLHGLAPCPALLQVIPTTFSPSLLHFVSHPTALILRIAQEYLTLPPPASDPAKFWSLFQSIGSRVEESEKTVYGSTGSGSGDLAEFVVEATIRYAGVSSRKRTLERELYGFLESLNGICDINLLPSLQTLFKSIPTIEQQVSHEQGPSTSFNLNLTDSQQQARANVPLPYAHQNAQDVGGTIYYEYSDGDDYDADDPDEDLDI
ncbi:hypothetical protein DL96DRAFT_1702767 [Flagelloscypha sp. PMI_526]|nr:hypothetical protein DL96DRAFT_1702767 [Flagelloscypha sp. PMI_526]